MQIEAGHHHALLLETKHDILPFRFHANKTVVALAPDTDGYPSSVHQPDPHRDRPERSNVKRNVDLEHPPWRATCLGRGTIVALDAKLGNRSPIRSGNGYFEHQRLRRLGDFRVAALRRCGLVQEDARQRPFSLAERPTGQRFGRCRLRRIAVEKWNSRLTAYRTAFSRWHWPVDTSNRIVSSAFQVGQNIGVAAQPDRKLATQSLQRALEIHARHRRHCRGWRR